MSPPYPQRFDSAQVEPENLHFERFPKKCSCGWLGATFVRTGALGVGIRVMRFVFTMEAVTLPLGIPFLFWPYILNPDLMCSLFSKAAETSQQVTNFITLLSLNFPRDYYVYHCQCWHFSVILRICWFFQGGFPWMPEDVNRNHHTVVFGSILVFAILQNLYVSLNISFNPCFSFSHPFKFSFNQSELQMASLINILL